LDGNNNIHIVFQWKNIKCVISPNKNDWMQVGSNNILGMGPLLSQNLSLTMVNEEILVSQGKKTSKCEEMNGRDERVR
jgi:hypothetical protein